MRVVVFDPEMDDIESETFTPTEEGELPLNVTAILTAEELEPAHIVNAGSVGWGELTLELPDDMAQDNSE